MSLYKTYKSGEELIRQSVFIPDGYIGLTRRELSMVIEKAQGKTKEEFISDICVWLSGREENIINFRKQEYISIIKGEIERLEGGKNEGYESSLSNGGLSGYNKAIDDQISHLQSELLLIEEDK